ncbi:MAG: hypothetical protein OHK0038_02280 [Flammeovirgaceae bacterium]
MVSLCVSNIYAQKTLPDGRFLTQKAKIGEEITYVLTFRHIPSMEVVFADSSFDFTPFEYIGREFYPTKTIGIESVDSVVFKLMTFELADTQYLSIPVYEIEENGNKKPIFPEKDFILVEKVVLNMPDSLQLLSNTNMALVKKAFNYPYWMLAGGIVLLIAVLIFVFFGRSIRRAYRLKRLKKENLQFILRFDSILNSTLNSKLIEDALKEWKIYSSKLTNIPLYSYTTKEIRQIIPSEKLNASLKHIDKAIYAGILDEQKVLKESLYSLKEYAEEAYQKKVEEIKHG